MFKEVSD